MGGLGLFFDDDLDLQKAYWRITVMSTLIAAFCISVYVIYL